MVTVVPAMVSVPGRLGVEGFAATLKVAAPEPDPVAPLVSAIHAALLAAVHAHPAPVVTVLLPVPPAAVSDCSSGETAGAQTTAPRENVFVRIPPLRPPGPI